MFRLCVTFPSLTVLIGVKVLQNTREEMKALEDDRIVALFLRRDAQKLPKALAIPLQISYTEISLSA